MNNFQKYSLCNLFFFLLILFNKSYASELISGHYCLKDTVIQANDLEEINKLNVIDDPLTVDFKITNDTTCSGTVVKFTSEVTGKGPFKYSWEFGDNQTSTAKDPTHVYNSLGCETASFNVKLTVSNDSLSQPITKKITVLQKPDITLYDINSPFDPFSNCANASIINPVFSIEVGNNSSSSCANSYTLDWGDGGGIISNPVFPLEHTYDHLGAFDMVLSAKGTNGCSNSVKYVVKNQTNPSGGLISPGTTTNLCAPTDSLRFEIAKWGTNSPGTKYLVNYGDNSPIIQLTQEQLVSSAFFNTDDPASSANYPIPHVYKTTNCPSSEFTATLTVQNSCDRTTFTADNITILIKPEVDFEVPPACLNSPITIKNTTNPGGGISCSPLANYTWDFGDGTPLVNQPFSYVQNVGHTYTKPGTYDITVMAENFCGKDTMVKTVTIKPLPTATIEGDALVCQGETLPSIVFKAINGDAPYTFTYRINNGNNKTVISDSLSNTVSVEVPTDKPGIYKYTLLSVQEGSDSECMQIQSGEATVEVISAVSATISGTDTVCVNSVSPRVLFRGQYGTAPYTFTYNINGGTDKTITTVLGDTVSIKVSTTTGGTFKYNLTGVKDNNVNASACTLELNDSATVFVNDQPPEQLVLDNHEYCNGETTSPINFSNTVPGTTYTWSNSNTSIGLTSNGSGNINSFTAKNSGPNPITSTITVTPSSYGCLGVDQTFSIKVNPAASVVFSQEDQVICSGETTTEITLSSETAGVDLSWTVEQTEGISETLQLSGTSSIPAQILTNTTNKPININFKAKATLVSATTCSGIENIYTITVYPRPFIQETLTDTICSGYNFNITPVQSGSIIVPSGTKYTWDEPVISPAGALTGFSAQNMPVSTIGQTILNTTSALATATYTVTPIGNNCEGETFNITVFVIPNTSLIPVSDIILCTGDFQDELVFGNNAAGTVLRWTSDNVNIGMPAQSGSDRISSFTAINSGTAPEKATIKVESNSELGSSSCDVAEIQFSIMVNPSAQVNNPGTQNACYGETVSILFSTVNTSGITTYEWTNSNTKIGLDASGAGDISFNTINPEDSIITAVIGVTPTYTNNGLSCSGVTEQFLIKVNPPLIADQPEDQSVCSDNMLSEIVLSGNTTDAVYNWTINNSTIGLPESGTGNIPEFTAFNDNSDSVVAVVSVVPSLNGCEGESRDFTITVYPSSVILKQPSSSSICLGEEPTELSVIHTTGVKIPNYQWYSNTSNSLIGATLIPEATNSIYHPPYSSTSTSYYFCEITFPGGGGCNSLTSEIAKVKVSPNPIVVLNDEQINKGEEIKICPNEEFPVKVRGAEDYNWSYGFSGDSIMISDIGDYRVIGTSNVGCRDTFPFSVSYKDFWNYTIASDKEEISNDQSTVIFSTQDIPGSFYKWDFGDSTNAFGSNVEHTFQFDEDGYIEVSLVVENPEGCKEMATKKIGVDYASMPNTFTPNGDGINDIFLKGWNIRVFNRNDIVFYDGDEGWDGNNKGTPAEPDTYFYILKDETKQGAIQKKYFVTLIR